MHSNIRVGSAGVKGRGVFAKKHFKKDEVIEICPVIILAGTDALMADRTILNEYMYAWTDDGLGFVLALGYGSLYNHDDKPNASWWLQSGTFEVIIRAVRHIRKGEEVMIAYRPDDPSE